MGSAKGTVLIGAVKYLRKHKEEAKKILDEDLHHYLSQRISPAAWYPEQDSLALIRTLVQLVPGDRDQALRGFGVMTAKELGKGIYSHLVEDGGSSSSTYALWSAMHDTGQLLVTSEARHESLFRLVGYEHPSAEMCVIIGAYIQETIRMGGRNASVSKIDCVLSGSPECRWRATW